MPKGPRKKSASRTASAAATALRRRGRPPGKKAAASPQALAPAKRAVRKKAAAPGRTVRRKAAAAPRGGQNAVLAEQLARLAEGLDTVDALVSGMQTMRTEIQALSRKVDTLLAARAVAAAPAVEPGGPDQVTGDGAAEGASGDASSASVPEVAEHRDGSVDAGAPGETGA